MALFIACPLLYISLMFTLTFSLCASVLSLPPVPGGDNSYYDLSQKLRQRIIDMKIKIDRQVALMTTMKEQIKAQVDEMQRMEVGTIGWGLEEEVFPPPPRGFSPLGLGSSSFEY